MQWVGRDCGYVERKESDVMTGDREWSHRLEFPRLEVYGRHAFCAYQKAIGGDGCSWDDLSEKETRAWVSVAKIVIDRFGIGVRRFFPNPHGDQDVKEDITLPSFEFYAQGALLEHERNMKSVFEIWDRWNDLDGEERGIWCTVACEVIRSFSVSAQCLFVSELS